MEQENNVQVTNDVETKEEKKELTFDEMLKEGNNQAEFDRRVQKAINTAKISWAKEQEGIADNKAKEESDTVKDQLISVFKKGYSADEAEFIQFKVSKMDGDFEENLNKYLEEHPIKKEEIKKTTGFPQKLANEQVSDEKAYLDKKYANNPYYKK